MDLNECLDFNPSITEPYTAAYHPGLWSIPVSGDTPVPPKRWVTMKENQYYTEKGEQRLWVSAESLGFYAATTSGDPTEIHFKETYANFSFSKVEDASLPSHEEAIRTVRIHQDNDYLMIPYSFSTIPFRPNVHAVREIVRSQWMDYIDANRCDGAWMQDFTWMKEYELRIHIDQIESRFLISGQLRFLFEGNVDIRDLAMDVKWLQEMTQYGSHGIGRWLKTSEPFELLKSKEL